MRSSLFAWTTQPQVTWQSFVVTSFAGPMTCKLVYKLERVRTGGMIKLVISKFIFIITSLTDSQLQIIVCADGSAGINFEHTGVDGHTVLRYGQ